VAVSTSSAYARWVRTVAWLSRRNPLERGRIYLPNLLLAGRTTKTRAFDPSAVCRAIPEGALLDCRHGVRVRLHRDRMYLNPFLFGEYEAAQTPVYLRLVRRGDTVIDAGANFGWFAALFGKAVGPSGKVFAFEPVPAIAEITADTLELNGVDRTVELVEAGLGAEPGEFSVYTFDGYPLGFASAALLYPDAATDFRCRLVTLDGYLCEHGVARVDFLKVDVEGFERDVFRGAASLLRAEDAPIVAFEVNVQCLKALDVDPGEVVGELEAAGYSDFWIVAGRGKLEPVTERRAFFRSGDFVAAKPARAQSVI
jgi:FkbM family methyltransferase